MIYHCDICDEDHYVPGEFTDPICPECRVSRSRENVKIRARKRLDELAPGITKKFGMGATFDDLAVCPEGREYIGWHMALYAPSEYQIRRKKTIPSHEDMPTFICTYLNAREEFNCLPEAHRAYSVLTAPGCNCGVSIPAKFIRLYFETVK